MAIDVWRMLGFVGSIVLLGARPALGAVEEFDDKLAWEEAAGSFTTIDFTGFPQDTLITDQYADLGVTFTDGFDLICYSTAFPNDGVGLDCFPDTTLVFNQPMHTISADFPGLLYFELYSGGALIYSSSLFGGAGSGFFGGLVVDQSFDMVVLRDPLSDAFIDDLHFGPVPAPGSIFLFAAAACIGTRRREA